jgi:hypothetical protein
MLEIAHRTGVRRKCRANALAMTLNFYLFYRVTDLVITQRVGGDHVLFHELQ